MSDDHRIYVACLACYNEGRLHGVWIDCDYTDADEIDSARAGMQSECGHTDNDWAIHDHEGFGFWEPGESEPFERICTFADLHTEHGDAFDAWLSHDPDYESEHSEWSEHFTAAYRGSFASDGDYAADLSEQYGDVPDHIFRFVDFEAMEEEMISNGEIRVTECNGLNHVFSTC